MTPADYWKQVSEACDKATPGPWSDAEYPDITAGDGCTAVLNSEMGFVLAVDAEFIAIARTALPLALARIEELEAALNTRTKASAAWEGLFNERNRLGRDYGDKLDAIGGLLADNGCDCGCDHDFESHDDDCERCLACRVSAVLSNR